MLKRILRCGQEETSSSMPEKSVIMAGEENGVTFGDYVPPDEVYTRHPDVDKVEFLDENNRLLNPVTDFLYGKKLKIKVYTVDARSRETLSVSLEGKSKSENQAFDLIGIRRYHWMLSLQDDDTAETPLFQLNPQWYSDDFEEYDYNDHKTKVKAGDLNEFFAEIIFHGQRVYLPPAGQRLRPVAYKRNYEELIGLFNTNNSGTKDLLTNYENKFIDSIPNIKNIVDDFSEFMYEDHPDLTLEDIRNKVATSATELWKEAVWQNQGYRLTNRNVDPVTGVLNTTESEVQPILDDRPLYWARLVMEVILKRHPIFEGDIDFERSLVKRGTELEKMIQLFEEKSRNYTGVDFSAARGKRVLITGFDPFFLDEFKDRTGENIRQSNPSGVVALALAYTDRPGFHIQTMVVPVRYTDFDSSQSRNQGHGEGIIEKYIGTLVEQVDMIITISQYRPGENVIDMFATCRRGGRTKDNQNYTREIGSKALDTPFEWIPTTLPRSFAITPFVKLNWEYNNVGSVPGQFPPSNDMLITEGPGGNYLSNEIFYRVAKIRMEHRPTLPSGHFHIAQIQSPGEELRPGLMAELLSIVKNAVDAGLNGL
jgi:hypothetical protein